MSLTSALAKRKEEAYLEDESLNSLMREGREEREKEGEWRAKGMGR